MNVRLSLTLFILTTGILSFAQQLSLEERIDSLILADTKKPFNGIILVARKGKTEFSKIHGFSKVEEKEPLKLNDLFVIGSISKQFTAVLVLRELDQGRLELNTPIHSYLPELTQSWADTVTVHHLLTHTHGITQLDQPTAFEVGTQYSYSQIGFDLLARIIEKTSGKNFAELSMNLFEKCAMKNTFHPDIHAYAHLVNGYTESQNGNLEVESESFENYVAAGSFISTVEDLAKWNTILFSGKLLKKEMMKMLLTKQQGAVRNHPLFGITEYGYGITIDTKDDIMQLGQTGFAPGFVSMNYFFPNTSTSLIVLSNIAYDSHDLTKTFYYHLEILKMIRNEIKNDN